MDKRIVITISREFGSGGRDVGQLVAKELGISFVDRRIIGLAAEKSGLSETFIENSDEKVNSTFFNHVTSSQYVSDNSLLEYSTPSGNEAFFAQADVIREIAKRESCVIIGRCSGHILRHDPNRIAVFIRAELPDRIRRAKAEYNMNSELRPKEITDIDKGRAKYYLFNTGEKWGELHAFDIVINTSKFGIDGAVAAICGLARRGMADMPD
jgi:cytidylate kinase